MTEKNGRDVENKYKDMTNNFLTLMKENRQREKEKKENIGEQTDENINVTSVVYSLSHSFLSVFNKINYWVDVMLASGKRIKLLSLFLTLTLCYFVNGGIGITTTKSIDYINDVVVSVNHKEDYEVVGYDENVTIQLIGDYGSIQWAKIMDEFRVVLNVQNQLEGSYEIKYEVEGLSQNLDVQVIPEKTNIHISKLSTRPFALSYQFVNKEKLDAAYQLKDPELALFEVDVTAGEYTLDRIDRVVALIDVENITSSIYQQKASVAALDSNGNVLNVSFGENDAEVMYNLDVTTYSKTVPIRLEKEGNVNSQYVLTNLKPSIETVTIYGLEENLKDIEYVTAKVNVDGKTENTRLNSVIIDKPNEVSKLSAKTLEVDIEVEKKQTVEITDIPIAFESVPTGLTAKFIDSATTTISVTGAKSKVEKLNKSNIIVYIDLTNAKVGTAKYQLNIANKDSNLSYQFMISDSVDVAVSQGNS